MLAFHNGALVGVLARLGSAHGAQAGKWYVEWALVEDGLRDKVYSNLDAASAHFEQVLSASGEGEPSAVA